MMKWKPPGLYVLSLSTCFTLELGLLMGLKLLGLCTLAKLYVLPLGDYEDGDLFISALLVWLILPAEIAVAS